MNEKTNSHPKNSELSSLDSLDDREFNPEKDKGVPLWLYFLFIFTLILCLTYWLIWSRFH